MSMTRENATPVRATAASGSDDGEAGLKFAALGGVVGALAASSCCILPLGLFSLGVGGAWIGNLAALAPYQPIFLTLTAVILGFGFWRVYRPRPACTAGTSCARPLPRRLVKTGLWFATVLTGAALAFPVIADALLAR